MSWWQNDTAIGDSNNLAKFLDFLGQAEGADYDTIVGGSKFSDFSKHPGVVGLRTKEGPSTAAGRYQITQTTYNDVAPKVGVNDFSKESQDRIAIELIRRKGALEDVSSGNFQKAIEKLGGTWASLPSSPYSQPKKSWEEVNQMLGVKMASADAAQNWWANDAPVQSDAVGQWWANDTPVGTNPAQAQSVPAGQAPTPTPKPPQQGPQPSVLSRIGRGVDDFVRGAADMITFGTADEIAAKLDSLVGGGQSGKKSYDEALAAQRARDKEGGGARIAGQVGGALVPTVGVVRAVDGATRGARALAGAATGAIQGGLYGAGSAEGDIGQRLEKGATGAAIGAAFGGAVGTVLPATASQQVNGFMKRAGSVDDAAVNAEIIQRARTEFLNPARQVDGKLPALSAKELNQRVTSGFIREGKDAIAAMPKNDPNRKALADALARGVNNSQDELAALSKVPGGAEVAAIITKAQRSESMLAALPAKGGIAGTITRETLDRAPASILTGATLGVPLPLKMGSTGIGQRLLGRQSREQVGKKLIEKQGKIADDVLPLTGPSSASKSVQTLKQLSENAQAAQKAKIEAAKASKATKAVKVENPNTAISELQGRDPTYLLGLNNPLGPPRNADQMGEFSKVLRQQMEARAAREAAQKAAAGANKAPEVSTKIQVLQDTRTPLSGAFQEFLPGGRSGLNLKSGEAIDALRLVSRQLKDRPVGQAAKDILKSGNVSDEAAFYGLQNQVRKLQEQGILTSQPGALSSASAGSPVRNPISYAEAVRTAGEAADLARKAAPNKELAQFATKVAGIKTPTAKAQAVADRLAKSTDPAEIQYLQQFVEPLTQFGKK
jgi:muramidase (phage lysozyme)